MRDVAPPLELMKFSMRICMLLFFVFIWTLGLAGAPDVNLPESFLSLPADSSFVFSVDVKKIVASPLYQKAVGEQSAALEKKFDLMSGINLARDIDYVAGACMGAANAEAVVIVDGSFDREKALRILQDKFHPVEKIYGKYQILAITEPGTDGATGVEKSVVFLNDRTLVIGDLEAVKNVLDVFEKKKPGILSNPVIASAIQISNGEDMFWFAGDVESVMRSFPVNTPLMQPGLNAVVSIKNIVGAMNFTEGFSGKITATAVDSPAAEKLALSLQMIIDIARSSGKENQELKMLLNGLMLSRDAENINIRLNYPAGFFEQFMKALDGRKTEGSHVVNVP